MTATVIVIAAVFVLYIATGCSGGSIEKSKLHPPEMRRNEMRIVIFPGCFPSSRGLLHGHVILNNGITILSASKTPQSRP